MRIYIRQKTAPAAPAPVYSQLSLPFATLYYSSSNVIDPLLVAE